MKKMYSLFATDFGRCNEYDPHPLTLHLFFLETTCPFQVLSLGFSDRHVKYILLICETFYPVCQFKQKQISFLLPT